MMEPLLVSQEARSGPGIADLAVELAQQPASFRSSLPSSVMESLAALVRSMNCYFRTSSRESLDLNQREYLDIQARHAGIRETAALREAESY